MRCTRGRFQLLVVTIAAALASAIVAPSGGGTAGASVRAISVQGISWRTCPPGSPAAQVGFTCATVRVPLDYQDPAGPKIKLAVVRHAAAGPARRGVIFINPGGPGFSGTDLIPRFIGFMPRVLLRDYDIVSWDPRGVGASTAVQCFPNAGAETAFLGDDADFPARPHQQAGYISRWASFGKICKARNGALLRHVSTADTARDLNLLRRELGQPKLNYIGVPTARTWVPRTPTCFPAGSARWCLTAMSPPPPGLTADGQTRAGAF